MVRHVCPLPRMSPPDVYRAAEYCPALRPEPVSRQSGQTPSMPRMRQDRSGNLLFLQMLPRDRQATARFKPTASTGGNKRHR
ncbi:hypothetical protein NXC14_CH01923 [Rhizobium sp. NXC14]|nr:hypothetical protein NXC14_CH01923 [Rhizobium sp. NXC14]